MVRWKFIEPIQVISTHANTANGWKGKKTHFALIITGAYAFWCKFVQYIYLFYCLGSFFCCCVCLCLVCHFRNRVIMSKHSFYDPNVSEVPNCCLPLSCVLCCEHVNSREERKQHTHARSLAHCSSQFRLWKGVYRTVSLLALQ